MQIMWEDFMRAKHMETRRSTVSVIKNRIQECNYGQREGMLGILELNY